MTGQGVQGCSRGRRGVRGAGGGNAVMAGRKMAWGAVVEGLDHAALVSRAWIFAGLRSGLGAGGHMEPGDEHFATK